MEKPPTLYPVQVRTSPRAKLAFDRVTAVLRNSERVRWHGKRVTKEVVFAAVWLWLEDLGETCVVELMAEFLPRLESEQRARATNVRGETSPPDAAPVIAPSHLEIGQIIAEQNLSESTARRQSERSRPKRKAEKPIPQLPRLGTPEVILPPPRQPKKRGAG